MTRNPVSRSFPFAFFRPMYIHESLASICRTVFFSLIVAALLAQTVGCAHDPKSLPADGRNSVQSLGILAVGLEPDVSVGAPTAEKLSTEAAISVVPDNLFELILAPVLVPLAAISGAATAAPEEQAMAASVAIETAVTEMRPAESLARRIGKLFERQVHAPNILLYGSEIPRQGEGIDYQRLAEFAVDAVLEIRSAFIYLRSGGAAAYPDPYPTWIHIGIETRLVRVPDGTVLFDRTFHNENYCKYPRCTGVQGMIILRGHSFFKLAADDAALLREFLDRAFTRLSENIVDFYSLALRHHRHYKPYYRSHP